MGFPLFVEQEGEVLPVHVGQVRAEDTPVRVHNLPDGKTLEDKFVLGLYGNGEDALLGVIDIVRHWPTKDEWIIGLFLLDPVRRNGGLGARLHRDLEQWVRGQGGTRLRLVVQVQNPGELRFWQRQGYYATTGQMLQKKPTRENIIHLLRKPLET